MKNSAPFICAFTLATLAKFASAQSAPFSPERDTPHLSNTLEISLATDSQDPQTQDTADPSFAADPRLLDSTKKISQAEALEAQRQFDAADVLRTEAIAILVELYGKDSRYAIVQLNNQAKMLLHRGRSERAETLLRGALTSAKKNDGEQGDLTLQVTHTLSMACVRQSKRDEAIALQQHILGILEQGPAKSPGEMATAYSNAAHIYNEAEREKEGQSYAQRALKLFEELQHTEGDDYAIALNNLGGAYLGQKRFADAEAILQRSYDLSSKLHGANSLEMRNIINNLAVAIESVADIENDDQRLDAAEALYRRSLLIAEGEFGPESLQVALRLGNIASILSKRHRLAEAEVLLRNAVQIENVQLPKTAPQRVITRMKLVHVTQLLGNATEAERLSQETLSDAEAAHGKESEVVAFVLHELGEVRARLNRPIEAEQTYWRAFKLREKLLGPDHIDVARSLNNVALLVQARGDYKNPEPMFRRVLQINQLYYGENDFRVGQDVLKIATNLKLQKRWKEAETEAQHAITIYDKTFGTDHHLKAAALQELASIQHLQKNYDQEEASLRNALSVLKNCLGARHPRTVDAMFRLSSTMRNTAKLFDAERLARDAYLIMIAQPSNRRPSDKYLNNMGDVYRILLRDMEFPASTEASRLEALRNGIDPGPLPGYNT